jgi:histidinol-phosphate phosphatase family protein
MGTPDRLKKTETDVIKGKLSKLSRKNKQSAVFLDRDGTLIQKIDLLHKQEDLKLIPGAADAVKKINTAGFLSFLVTNQSVIARNLCSIHELGLIHNKLETLLINEAEAYLNEIFFCPHHPDKGYPEENPLYKIQCNCRKPKLGMIEEAVSHYNVDIRSSWMIGDSIVDVMTGKNAGLKTILIQAEENWEYGEVKPDFVFSKLIDAVNTILKVNLI